MAEEYDSERFWEYGKYPRRLADGVAQFSRLVSYGLQPHHYLLDVGCGWLRGGINLIEYLDVGHYYGFDKEETLLDTGKLLLEGKDLIHKKPMIKCVHDSKDLKGFLGRRMRFDYMLAVSVFTHTDPYMTERLFNRVIPYLKDTGRFFATFFESKCDYARMGAKHFYRGNEYKWVQHPLYFFEDLAMKNGMIVEYLNIPRDVNNQNWMCFCRNNDD